MRVGVSGLYYAAIFLFPLRLFVFPELPVYTLFVSPRWLCRIGDFRSIEEADAMMRQLEETGAFKEITIVREQINIPL